MMYATAAILYAAMSITLGPETRRFLGGSVGFIAIASSLVHYRLNHTPGFQTLFGLMVVTVFSQCVWLLNFKVKNLDAVKDMKHLALYGAGRCSLKEPAYTSDNSSDVCRRICALEYRHSCLFRTAGFQKLRWDASWFRDRIAWLVRQAPLTFDRMTADCMSGGISLPDLACTIISYSSNTFACLFKRQEKAR